MTEPLVVTISHNLGRAEAKRRLAAGLDQIRALVAPYVSSLDTEWQHDSLLFHVSALGQRVEGAIHVLDEMLRIEMMLPLLLRLLAKPISGRIRQEGVRLLEKPKE